MLCSLALGVRWTRAHVQGGHLDLACTACGQANHFEQPYPYHAGFGDTIFVYNEAGNCTLVWGTYDETYLNLLGAGNPWSPPASVRHDLEAQLPLSPRGDQWSFKSSARCQHCGAAISAPMATGNIYYLEYSGSVILGRAGLPSRLAELLGPRPST